MDSFFNSKDLLIDLLVDRLKSVGYETEVFGRYCLDIIAKKGTDKPILIKVLLNVDSFDKRHAFDLNKLSYIMNASPIIISLRGRNFEIYENVVHMRFEIPVILPETLFNTLEGDCVFTLSRKGKTCVFINTTMLKDARLEQNQSFEMLSKALNISKKTLFLAEKHGYLTDILVDKLESFFNKDLKETQNLFDILEKTYSRNNMTYALSEVNAHDVSSVIDNTIKDLIERIGFINYFFSFTPSNLVGTRNGDIIFCEVIKNKLAEKQIDDLKRFGDFFNSKIMIISENVKYDIPGVAVFNLSEIQHIKSRKELFDLILNRE
ncbi:MAG: hypothetical protein K0B02_03915 [DPANN group archaeon]|nr:hypothetical protein [DPANN group archaeon]